jgi:hypothetical protein
MLRQLLENWKIALRAATGHTNRNQFGVIVSRPGDQLLLQRPPMVGSLNCTSGQYVKGYAGPRLRHCSRISAGGLLLPGCRFGALSSGCEHYIRNGPAITYTWWRDRDLVHPVRRRI